MSRNLYFICPTDNLESIINSTFNEENYFVTSLANSVTLNRELVKKLFSIIKSKKINHVTFILSDNNTIVQDALRSKNFKDIRGLGSFYERIEKHKCYVDSVWCSSDIQQIIISYILNHKKREFENLINSSVKQLNINAIIYNSHRDEFSKVRGELLSLDFFNLN